MLQDPGKVARLQGRLEVAFRLLLRRTQREGLLARVGTRGGTGRGVLRGAMGWWVSRGAMGVSWLLGCLGRWAPEIVGP